VAVVKNACDPLRAAADIYLGARCTWAGGGGGV